MHNLEMINYLEKTIAELQQKLYEAKSEEHLNDIQEIFNKVNISGKRRQVAEFVEELQRKLNETLKKLDLKGCRIPPFSVLGEKYGIRVLYYTIGFGVKIRTAQHECISASSVEDIDKLREDIFKISFMDIIKAMKTAVSKKYK